MDNQIEQTGCRDENSGESEETFDYTHVKSVARIALYDDLHSAPRVTEITPAPTGEFIESLASKIYDQAKAAGGTIPYTVIREVAENFIHARFAEATVSILDEGNTIRFADQGPGIPFKDQAQIPGFTSAVEPMKHYIRGVGSGLPIVKEYLDLSHGTITIEDNLGTGAVVTISLRATEERSAPPESISFESSPTRFDEIEQDHPYPHPEPKYPIDQHQYHSPGAYTPAPAVAPLPIQAPYSPIPAPQYQPQPCQPVYGYAPEPQYTTQYTHPYAAAGAPYYGAPQRYAHPAPAGGSLTEREKAFLTIFLKEGTLGVTDLVHLTGVPQSSTHSVLKRLEEAGLIEKTTNQKRLLTDRGYQVASTL